MRKLHIRTICGEIFKETSVNKRIKGEHLVVGLDDVKVSLKQSCRWDMMTRERESFLSKEVNFCRSDVNVSVLASLMEDISATISRRGKILPKM